MKNTRKNNRSIRFIILIFFLIISTLLGIMHQIIKIYPPVGVDALCPFGAIESAYILLTSGTMIPRIAVSSFILLGAILLTAVIFRRTFCGNICALGALQEIFGKIRNKILKKRFEAAPIIDKPARYIKYILLILIIFFTAKTAELVIRPYDPWVTYHHLFTPEVFTEFLFGFIILIISLIGSFFYDRFFCKYLCPLGAFLGLINKLGWFKVKKNLSTCIHCKACDKACPSNIKVESLDTINSSECINCNECINACPIDNTLYLGGFYKTRIKPFTFLIVSVSIFVLVVAATTVTNSFEWRAKPLTEQVKKTGDFNPDMIRGRMTIKEIAEASGIPVELFINEFKITNDETKKQIKEIHGKYDFDVDDIRDFVQNELNMQSK